MKIPLLPISVLLCVSWAIIFSSCSSIPRSAPRFAQPSTVPIQKAIAITKAKQASVGDKIQKAQAVVSAVSADCPQAKSEIDTLSNDLMEAYADNKEAELSLQSAEGARDQLDIQLKSTTELYNQLADNYDKSAVTIQGLRESRHTWVNLFWMATAATTLCAIWIFRKPLLAVVGGIGI